MDGEIITWDFLQSISENYPVAYIAVILTIVGFTLGATGIRYYVKIVHELIIKPLGKIIERLM